MAESDRGAERAAGNSRASADGLPRSDDLARFAAGDVRGPQLRRTLALVTVAWMFGSVWLTATSGAPLTLFARGLRASEFEFGLLSALPFIASLLSLPASLVIDRTGSRKKIFLWGLYLQRFMWFPIALAPVLIVQRFGIATASAAMGLFLVLVFIMHAGQAIGGPAWMSWMADIVPDRSRGKYFSRRRQWGIMTAIPAALVAGWLLDNLYATGAPSNYLTTLWWCAAIFMAAAIFGIVDIATFHAVPEVRAAPRHNEPLRAIFGQPLRDPQFLWFAGFVATLVFAVSFMGQFLTLYFIDKLKITSVQTQLILLIAPMLAQLAVLPVWGHAADRMGNKPVLAIASLGLVPVGLGWCFMSHEMLWLGYVLSALGAALWAGVEVANFNVVLEMAGSNESDDPEQQGGSNYVAVNSVIVNLAGCFGGLASGALAQSLRNWHWDVGMLGLGTFTFYEILFLISGVLRLLAAAVFLPHLHEPAARPTHEALRFMTANIYNNLFNAVLLPLRMMGIRR
jgi:MFS family permease